MDPSQLLPFLQQAEPTRPSPLHPLMHSSLVNTARYLDWLETEKTFIFHAHLAPGFRGYDVQLVVVQDKSILRIIVTGEEGMQRSYKAGTCRLELGCDVTFHYSIRLPGLVQSDYVSSEVKDDILIVTVLKRETEEKAKGLVENMGPRKKGKLFHLPISEESSYRSSSEGNTF